MFVINHRKKFVGFAVALMLIAITLLTTVGLNVGIDFNGGSLLEVSYTDRPDIEGVRESLSVLDLGAITVRPSGDEAFVLRSKTLTPEEKNLVLATLTGEAQEERFNSIGPVVGEELRSKAFMAIVIVIIAIILFITFAFRRVSEPVSSWKYGLATIVALIHDILIPTGVAVLLGYYLGFEVNLLFVTALLAILGYSVNDTIVVFDRVRENLLINQEDNLVEDFKEVVGRSLRQTIARSINTSLTLVFVLLTLYFFGADATKDFVLILLVGVLAGTYSSIFIASPLLVFLAKKE
jgi:preprotein translocase subunit SecF